MKTKIAQVLKLDKLSWLAKALVVLLVFDIIALIVSGEFSSLVPTVTFVLIHIAATIYTDLKAKSNKEELIMLIIKIVSLVLYLIWLATNII